MPSAIAPHMFSFRSGRIALDFAATLMFRSSSAPQELLREEGALAAWLTAAGILDRGAQVTARDLSRAKVLRETIYRLAVAAASNRSPAADDIALLNQMAAGPPPVPELVRFGRARLRGDAGQGLTAIARDALSVLGSSDVMRLRQCGRGGCTRLFLDRSRGANRVWCGMRECGNRVNAAAYRRRKRGTGAG